MPSTTTTSLTIGSIFDLLTTGAPASSATEAGDFDSLLQSPPAVAPQPAVDQPSQTPPPRTDASQCSPTTAENPSADAHSNSAQSASDGTIPQPVAPKASKDQSPPVATPAQGDSSQRANSKQRPEAEQVDAQSLAAIAAVNPGAIRPAQPKSEEEAPPSRPVESANGAQRVRPAAGNQTVALAKGQAATKDTTATTQESHSTKNAEEEGDPSAAARGASAASSKASAAEKSAAAGANAQKTAGEKTLAVDPLAPQELQGAARPVEPAQSSSDGSQNHHRDNAHPANEASSLNPQPALPPNAADPALTAQPPLAPPAVSPLVAQTPTPDAASSRPTARLSESIAAPQASGQRARLPADVLTPSNQPATRRTTSDIDTTRLLTRVARAVTTAQERDGEVRLRLSPPELGSLRLDVKVQDGALVAHLQTETDAARTAILDNLPALRDRLADQGVRIERFDVDLMQHQPGGMADQPGGRQQEPMPPQARVVLPPRVTASAAPPTTTPSVPRASSTAGGLNVIV